MVAKIKLWLRTQAQEVVDDWRKNWYWIIGVMIVMALLTFEFCEAIR